MDSQHTYNNIQRCYCGFQNPGWLSDIIPPSLSPLPDHSGHIGLPVVPLDLCACYSPCHKFLHNWLLATFQG